MFRLRDIFLLQNVPHPSVISGVKWQELGFDRLPPSDSDINTVKLYLHPFIWLHSRELTCEKHNFKICTLFRVPGTWPVNYGPCNGDHSSGGWQISIYSKSEAAARVLNTGTRVFVQRFPGALPWWRAWMNSAQVCQPPYIHTQWSS